MLDVQAVDDRILLIVVAVERKNPDDVLRFQRMVCSALPKCDGILNRLVIRRRHRTFCSERRVILISRRGCKVQSKVHQ